MTRRQFWALTLAVAAPALGAAVTSSTAAPVPAVTMSTRTIATGAGSRPVHMIRIVPGRGARVEADGDHRIGMLGAIAGSLADGETRVDNDAVSGVSAADAVG